MIFLVVQSRVLIGCLQIGDIHRRIGIFVRLNIQDRYILAAITGGISGSQFLCGKVDAPSLRVWTVSRKVTNTAHLYGKVTLSTSGIRPIIERTEVGILDFEHGFRAILSRLKEDAAEVGHQRERPVYDILQHSR